MKKLFTLIAMLCMVTFISPAMAIDLDDDGEQTQGGINFYIENGAFSAGDLAGSANIVAGQVSFQHQENDFDLNFCNREEIYYQDQNNYYYNGYDYEYFRGETTVAGEYEIKGQNQSWFQANRFSTGYGQAEMIQQGYQESGSAVFTQTPGLDLNNLDIPEHFGDNYDIR